MKVRKGLTFNIVIKIYDSGEQPTDFKRFCNDTKEKRAENLINKERKFNFSCIKNS